MRRTICFLVLIAGLNLSCKSQYNICKTYVFTQTNFAGTIAVDENGNPRTPGATTAIFVYIKAKDSSLPKFDTAIIKGKKYSVTISPFTTNKIEVGKKQEDETPIFINTAAGYKLWKLELTPALIPSKDTDNEALKILLKGEWKKKKISYSITKMPVKLSSEPRP